MKKNKSKQEGQQKLLPLKTTWQVYRKFLALLWQQRPKMVASSVLSTVWRALNPYVGILLSALIIQELCGNRDPERLFFLVSAALLSAAAISLISAFLNRFESIEMAGHYYYMRKLLSDKLLDMDYCILDDPETMQNHSTILQNQNGGGWGMYRAFSLTKEWLSALFTLLGGISLTVTLFTCKVPETAGKLTFLNSPLFLALIIGGLLLTIYIAPLLSNKADSYYAIYSGSHTLGNRLFGYFGFMGTEKKYGTDIRLYRQDLFCVKFNTDKEATFCSKGFFAKLARGPMGIFAAASSAVSVLMSGVVYLFVCLKAWAGAFGIGQVTQYISSLTRLTGGLSSLISTTGQIRINGSFLKQIFDFLEKPDVMYQGSLTVEKRRDRKYEVEFRDVSFRYPGSDQYALRHVNIKFTVGGRLAVVGQNGSGKTTFIKLLCRLYDPTEGTILLNGIDIRKYDYREYISIFSVVFQDFCLPDLPLGQNVAAATEYDEALARSCLEKAGFGQRLESLPQGLDTYLGKRLSKDGVDMSGGEEQKIALARAIYKDAPFIVLDEPTAALDPIAEAEIYSSFNDIVEDRTAIYISHRLSSCKFCDDILVFDKGAIVQQGSHELLVTDGDGKYHELWQAQAQYYNDQAAAAKM